MESSGGGMSSSKSYHTIYNPILYIYTKQYTLLYIVPRTFRLYEELEKAEHAQLTDQSVSYGLNEG